MSRLILSLLILASFTLPIKTLAADNDVNLDELIDQIVPTEDGTYPTPAPETIPVPETDPAPTPVPKDVPASEQPES